MKRYPATAFRVDAGDIRLGTTPTVLNRSYGVGES